MRTRTGVMLLTAALVAVGGASCSSCSKKKKEAPAQGSAGGATAVSKQAPASDELRGMLAMVPVASEAVVGLDVAGLRAADLYKAYQKDIESLAGAELEEIRKLCGFDPVERIDKVVGGGTGNRKHGDGTIVITGLGKADTMECLTKVAASPPKGVTVTIDGDYAKVVHEHVPDVHVPGTADIVPADAGAAAAPPPAAASDGGAAVMPKVPTESISLEFLDDKTLVVARRAGEAVDKAKMDEIIHLDPKQSVVGSPGFMEMIDGIDTTASVWFVVNGKTPGGQKLGGGLLKFDAAFGQIYVTSGLEIDATLRLPTPDAAERMADMAQRQVESMRRSILKDALGDVTIEHKDRDLHVNVKESRQQLERFVDEVGDLFAALLGG